MDNTQKWSIEVIRELFNQPFNDLLHQAHTVHRRCHNPNVVQIAKLKSIKTGACPEDCGYCGQSGHYSTHVEKEKLLSVEEIVRSAKEAKAEGATRFCMGAAWRCPPDKAFPQMKQVIEEVKALGMETCMTLGMLTQEQAVYLKEAGLDYYNHNIDTSPSYYEKIVSTRKFADRLDTLNHVREAGIHVCCGGILGLGESREDRVEFIHTLANMPTPPESVPINRLIPVAGTPLEHAEPVEGIELVRTIAVARITMPDSKVRLTAGRVQMSDELQALCFFAGANSIFIGDKLLTETNPQLTKDNLLLDKLGIEAESLHSA